jgi:hypothetical protein
MSRARANPLHELGAALAAMRPRTEGAVEQLQSIGLGYGLIALIERAADKLG